MIIKKCPFKGSLIYRVNNYSDRNYSYNSTINMFSFLTMLEARIAYNHKSTYMSITYLKVQI